MHVAIIGGGLAGCTMARVLLDHPSIEFDVFEAGPAVKEQGSAIGMAKNAQRAMDLMGIDFAALAQSIGGVQTKTSPLFIVWPFLLRALESYY